MFHRIASIMSLVLFGINPAVPSFPTGYGLYPSTAIVITVDHAADLVTVENANGIQFAFNGCVDLEVNDVVSLIMDANGTPQSVYDDKVVSAQFSGYCIENDD